MTINPINPEDLTVDEWLEDFEHLYEFVRDNYPYLSVKERTHGYNWLDLRDEFETLPPEVHGVDYKVFKAWQTIKPQGEADFNGEVIILIDNMVYSASEGFCFFGKKYEFATFYGTPSGGDGLMIYPLYYVLPNSKLVVESASSLGLDSSGNANEEVRTQPDIYYESDYGNHNELINFVINDLVNPSR